MVESALAGASAGLGASGQIVQGISQREQAQFQREIAEQNAQVARQRTDVQRARLAREQRRRMGRARNIAASRGVTMEGSPLEVLADQAAEQAEEQALVQFGGDVQALQQEARADAFREQGRQALTAGLIGAGSTLIEGIGQAGGNGQRRQTMPDLGGPVGNVGGSGPSARPSFGGSRFA